MKMLLLILVLVSGLVFAQSNKDKKEDACPITKKEAYIVHVKYDPEKCELNSAQSKFILKTRKEGTIERVYQYTRRLNAEVGIFDEEIE